MSDPFTDGKEPSNNDATMNVFAKMLDELSATKLILIENNDAIKQMLEGNLVEMDMANQKLVKDQRAGNATEEILKSMGKFGEVVSVIKDLGNFTDLLKVSGLAMLVRVLGRIADPIDEALSDIEDDLFEPLERVGEAIATLIYDQAPKLIDAFHSYLVPLVDRIVNWIEIEGSTFISNFIDDMLPKIMQIIDDGINWIMDEEDGLPKLIEQIKEVIVWIIEIKDSLNLGDRSTRDWLIGDGSRNDTFLDTTGIWKREEDK
jgi:hypothetical protein